MGTNNGSYVVSFSIVILLLVLLLLLLTYNSKCSMNAQYAPDREGFDNQSQRKDRSVAGNYNVDLGIIQGGSGNIQSSESGNNEVFSSLQSSQQTVENFYDPNPDLTNIVKNAKKSSSAPSQPSLSQPSLSQPSPSQGGSDEGFYDYANVNELSQLNPNSKGSPEFQACFPRDRLTANDLLPKDAADSKWARLNPSGTGDIHDQNYLTAGYHIGVNTVGQSLRNANLQLRSEIPNPQTPVGPWMISTIEPDLRQNTLEIGSAPSY